ncbi:hypothetical protein AGMMS49982_11220 [Bacteroidia bacterium]|nr:hypothetical protein AGMMS49982_11220 [Bacteroidia bacterium]
MYMKKMMLLAFVCLGGWSVMAQGSGSGNNSKAAGSAEPKVARATQPPQSAKSGQIEVLTIPPKPTYLPEAGSFSIGISANPFLDYLGNMFGSYTAKAPDLEGLAFGAKYFLTDENAVRANLKFGFDSKTDEHGVTGIDASSGAELNGEVTDTRSSSNLDVELHIGYEWHKGKGRVDGFYGAEVLFGYASSSTTYSYGNVLHPIDDTPMTNWDSSSGAETRRKYRPLESKLGASLTVGVGAFVGIEYFLAPQFSIGGEVGLEFAYTSAGQAETKTEDIRSGEREETTAHSGISSSNIGVRTNPNGHLFVSFYF